MAREISVNDPVEVKMARLDAIGEDELFDQIENGKYLKDICAELRVGYRFFNSWLRAEDGREQRYRDAVRAAGHTYAAKSVQTAEDATMENVPLARLQSERYGWYAAKLNDQYDTRQKDVSVNISVNDLHAQAMELLRDVTPKDVIDHDE